ncbi:MAG: hypothetical protein ABJA02_13135 [Acidobacteriota bacterium]
MQLSNISKYFLVLTLSAATFSACGGVNSGNNSAAPAVASDAPKTEPPYQNAEPEAYEAQIAQIRASGTEKYFIARKGDKWRVDNAYGDPSQITTIHSDNNYVLSPGTKTYAEFETGHGYDDRAVTVEAVTGGMINGRDSAIYEKTGSVNGMTTYRVTGIAGKPTESIMTVDEKLGFPVTKELYRLDGGRALDVTYMLTDYTTDVDDSLFNIPKDFKKVPLEDMRKTIVPPK